MGSVVLFLPCSPLGGSRRIVRLTSRMGRCQSGDGSMIKVLLEEVLASRRAPGRGHRRAIRRNRQKIPFAGGARQSFLARPIRRLRGLLVIPIGHSKCHLLKTLSARCNTHAVCAATGIHCRRAGSPVPCVRRHDRRVVRYRHCILLPLQPGARALGLRQSRHVPPSTNSARHASGCCSRSLSLVLAAGCSYTWHCGLRRAQLLNELALDLVTAAQEHVRLLPGKGDSILDIYISASCY